MNGPDPYETWKKSRADVDVDPRLGDRVLDALHASGEPAGLAEPPRPAVVRAAWGYVGAAALLVASLLFGLLRIESVVGLIFLLSSEGF